MTCSTLVRGERCAILICECKMQTTIAAIEESYDVAEVPRWKKLIKTILCYDGQSILLTPLNPRQGVADFNVVRQFSAL